VRHTARATKVGVREPAELAVTAAGEERRVYEISKRAVAGVEQASDLVVGEIAVGDLRGT
jgi:hypothetical protein